MKTTTLLFAGVLAFAAVACGEEEPKAAGAVTLKASATTGTTGSSSGGRYATTVQLTDFKINMKEIEFEMDDDKVEEITFKDMKLKGPFEIDLLNNSSSLTEVLGISELPNGRYEEIEFKIGKGNVAGSSMYGKSIYAAGTINGTPFVFWHDVDEDFEVDYADANEDLLINGQDLTVQINFNLGMAFNSADIDLASAVDSDKDGVIEIDPKGNDDNNKELAHQIKHLIKDLADLTERRN